MFRWKLVMSPRPSSALQSMKKARISETPRVMLRARVTELKRLNLYVFVSSSVDFLVPSLAVCFTIGTPLASTLTWHVTCKPEVRFLLVQQKINFHFVSYDMVLLHYVLYGRTSVVPIKRWHYVQLVNAWVLISCQPHRVTSGWIS